MLPAKCRHVNWRESAGTSWEAKCDQQMSYTWLWHTPLGMLLALMYEFMSITSLLHHWTTLLLPPSSFPPVLPDTVCHCVRLRLPAQTDRMRETSIQFDITLLTLRYSMCESDNIYIERSITAILICKICSDLYDALYIQHVLCRFVCGKICFQSKYKKNHLCACIPRSMLTWGRPRAGKDRSNFPLRARFEYLSQAVYNPIGKSGVTLWWMFLASREGLRFKTKTRGKKTFLLIIVRSWMFYAATHYPELITLTC